MRFETSTDTVVEKEEFFYIKIKYKLLNRNKNSHVHRTIRDRYRHYVLFLVVLANAGRPYRLLSISIWVN